MSKILFTADRYNFDRERFTFFVYDLDDREIVYKKEKINDLECPEFKLRRRPTFRPYGISQDQEHLYIASHSAIGIFDKKSYEYLGLEDRTKSFFNTHQILKTKDRLYICNASCDSLGILENSVMTQLDLNKFEIIDANIAPPELNPKDVIHPNSVLEHNGTIFVLLTHMTKGRYGTIVNIDRETFKVNYTYDVGNKLHDIVILNNKMYILSTGSGELIEFDLESHDITLHKLAEFEEFYLRGMVELEGNLLISFSRHFTKSPIRGYSYFKIFDVDEKLVTSNHIINKIDVINNLELMD